MHKQAIKRNLSEQFKNLQIKIPEYSGAAHDSLRPLEILRKTLINSPQEEQKTLFKSCSADELAHLVHEACDNHLFENAIEHSFMDAVSLDSFSAVERLEILGLNNPNDFVEEFQTLCDDLQKIKHWQTTIIPLYTKMQNGLWHHITETSSKELLKFLMQKSKVLDDLTRIEALNIKITVFLTDLNKSENTLRSKLARSPAGNSTLRSLKQFQDMYRVCKSTIEQIESLDISAHTQHENYAQNNQDAPSSAKFRLYQWPSIIPVTLYLHIRKLYLEKAPYLPKTIGSVIYYTNWSNSHDGAQISIARQEPKKQNIYFTKPPFYEKALTEYFDGIMGSITSSFKIDESPHTIFQSLKKTLSSLTSLDAIESYLAEKI